MKLLNIMWFVILNMYLLLDMAGYWVEVCYNYEVLQILIYEFACAVIVMHILCIFCALLSISSIMK